MGTPTTAGAGGRLVRRLRGWRSWVEPKHFWWGLLVVALAVSAVFGGLKTATAKDSYLELQAGQTFQGEQFHVTVEAVRLELLGYGTQLDIPSPGPGYALVVVETIIKNVSPETAEPQQSFEQSGPGLVQLGSKRDKVFNAENVRRLGYKPFITQTIQPGMTDRVVFTWAITRDSVKLGHRFVVQVNDFKHMYYPGMEERWRWMPAGRHGVYNLPLEDSR